MYVKGRWAEVLWCVPGQWQPGTLPVSWWVWGGGRGTAVKPGLLKAWRARVACGGVLGVSFARRHRVQWDVDQCLWGLEGNTGSEGQQSFAPLISNHHGWLHKCSSVTLSECHVGHDDGHPAQT